MASELTVLAHTIDRIGEEQPALARLHAEQPARHAGGSRRLFPRLPHLRERAGLGPRRSRRARARHRPRPPAQPGDGVDDLRFLPRGRCCRAIRRTSRRPARTAAAAIRRRREGSGRTAAVRHEVPAVHGTAAGEGARRHGVLSPQRAGVAERSRGRSLAVRRVGRGVPRDEPAPAAGVALRDDRAPARTTRSSAKTCARGSTCCRRSRTSGSARSRSGCA